MIKRLVFAVLFAPTLAYAEDENWSKIYEVFSHPRCANCHVPEDHRPRWSGPSYGETRYHGMSIHGGESRKGAETLPCSACHGEANAPVPHGPPGAPHWALAPVEMVWWEQSSAEVCAQIKDEKRNGGSSLAEIADHIAEDPLVLWGWQPGTGRAPAPYSAAEVAKFVRDWSEAGATCPK